MELKRFEYPVTALAFVRSRSLLLLAGEGNYLKIFDYTSGRLLSTRKVFSEQSIHGIVCSPEPATHVQPSTILIYGGRSVSVIEILTTQDLDKIFINSLKREIKTNDWIFDAALLPNIKSSDGLEDHQTAALITAHNDIIGFDIDHHLKEGVKDNVSVRTLASGPRSILYSAHIKYDEHGILVASGTVSGEIFVWSVPEFLADHDPLLWASHHKLTGHEGSVFGVCISETLNALDGPSRILASCSDDRTIRLWNISNSDSEDSIEIDGQCLSVVSGHASRIWSVRILHNHGGLPDLISCGEDGTTQLWQLSFRSDEERLRKDISRSIINISHKKSYAYHTGKNTWVSAIWPEADESWCLATGGADARIATYRINLDIGMTLGLHARSPMVEALQLANEAHTANGIDLKSQQNLTRAIFDAMMGKWELSRTIKSAIPSQPSGTLKGTAEMQLRSVSDSDYDCEVLYSEQGDFSTDIGFTMKARRQYVYRYQKSSDEISVWFVKPDGQSVDYLFHKLLFDGRLDSDTDPPEPNVTATVKASGHHLCERDTYVPDYAFRLEGHAIPSWQIKYTVTGPQKDYVSVANYSRDSSVEDVKGKRDGSNIGALKPNTGEPRPLQNDALKAYAWVNATEFLATTEQGSVLLGRLALNQGDTDPITRAASKQITWEAIGHHTDLSSASMINSLPSQDLAFLTGNNGATYVYQSNSKVLRLLSSQGRKVGYLKAHDCSSAWTSPSLTNGEAHIALLSRTLGSKCLDGSLVPPKLASGHSSPLSILSKSVTDLSSVEFVTTGSCIFDDAEIIIEGSRTGQLRIHHSPNTSTVMSGLHDQNAITVILPLQMGTPPKGRHYFLTAGRDGTYAYHKFQIEVQQPSASQLTTIHIAYLPFGPNVEGANIDSSTGNLTLWGFSSTRFIVWDESAKQEVMSVECGGAHRNWSYLYHEKTRGGSFVWTKASVCNVHYQREPSHRVLQTGGHGREIKAIAVSPMIENGEMGHHDRLLATGAEDTAVRIFKVHGGDYHCTNVLKEHTTGLQRLQWSEDGRWLFSAAGCEEFIAWRVRRLNGSPCVLCEARCPTVTNDRALRITDFSIDKASSDLANPPVKPHYLLTMAYSDSSIRVWRFHVKCSQRDIEEPRFNLLHVTSYRNNCLTQIHSLYSSAGKLLCTTSSDGYLAFRTFETQLAMELTEIHRHPMHQSSIHCAVVLPLLEDTHALTDYLIVTGGDDQALGVAHFTCSKEKTISINTASLLNKAHASAVTGIAYIGHSAKHNAHRFATVGTDQRLKIWLVYIDLMEENSERLKVKMERSLYTSVGDASCLDAYQESENKTSVVVAGIGLESWVLTDD